MRQRRASLTAVAVAAARALASQGRGAVIDPGDGRALALLPAPLGAALSAVTATALGRGRLSPLIARATFGLVDHLALRSAVLDALLCEELRTGVRQVVIVGAGLDSRAHRLAALASASVFEVDHPASQAAKRERARTLPVLAGALCYVPVELGHDALGASLERAGHDRGQASCFLIEGVLPYLSRAQRGRLWAAVAGSAPRGSALAASYIPADSAWLAHHRWWIEPSLRVLGEPLGDLPTPSELRWSSSEHGLELEHDWDLDAAAAALGLRTAGPLRTQYERIVLARRR
jgi:methyltransferase (TIGR00027 family)